MFTLILLLLDGLLRDGILFNNFNVFFEAKPMRFREMIGHWKSQLFIFYLKRFWFFDSIRLFWSDKLGLWLEGWLIGVRSDIEVVLIKSLVGDFDEAVLGELLRVEGGEFRVGKFKELETWTGSAEYHFEIILQGWRVITQGQVSKQMRV